MDHTHDVQLSECFNWRRVLRKVPEAIETFADKAAGLLTDRHHGVLLSGTTLMLEICEIEPNTIEQYRRHVPMLCKILRSLLMSGFAPEHDVGGITDPFLQVKVCSTDTNHIANSQKHALQQSSTYRMDLHASAAAHFLTMLRVHVTNMHSFIPSK